MTAPVNTTLYMRPDRNLALELVRVTEAGAMAAGRWVGRGDKEGGDGAAVDAMRQLVSSVSMRGVVVIGEGEKDEAPMLYNGEEVGNGLGPDCDFAVDPVDGTTLMAKGMPNAISVLAVAERGAMFDPSAVFYMDKIAVGPDAADAIDITAPVSENLRKVAKAKKSSVSDLTVCILDRPRHAELIAQVRATGARIRLISDGDVAGAIAAARPESGTDLLIGTGGTPEGIIAAAAMRCMGGVLQARLAPTDDLERQKAIDAGHDLDRILSTEDLVSGENVFFTATGVTDGDLLRGVRYSSGGAHTQSIVMRSKSGTVGSSRPTTVSTNSARRSAPRPPISSSKRPAGASTGGGKLIAWVSSLLAAYTDGYSTDACLDVRTRELLTFSMLVALGGADPQVKGHVAANLNVGKRRPTRYITPPSGHRRVLRIRGAGSRTVRNRPDRCRTRRRALNSVTAALEVADALPAYSGTPAGHSNGCSTRQRAGTGRPARMATAIIDSVDQTPDPSRWARVAVRPGSSRSRKRSSSAAPS